jgi:hypothetical protein
LVGVLALLLFQIIHNGVEVLQGLGKSVAAGRDVGVMEAKEGQAEDAEKLEGRIGLHLGLRNRVAGGKPRALDRGSAKRVASAHRKRVPVGDREAQMILEGLAEHDPVRIVPAVGKGLLTGRTLVLYCFERAKDCFGHGESPIVVKKNQNRACELPG